MKLLTSLFIGTIALAAVAQTSVQFNTRYMTGGNLNRKITVEPVLPWIKTGTNLVGGRSLQLHPVNGLVTTNLVSADYWVSIDGSNERLKMSVPDTNVTLQAVSLMVDVPTYYYTNTMQASGFSGSVTNSATITTSTNVGFTMLIDLQSYIGEEYGGYFYKTNIGALYGIVGEWAFQGLNSCIWQGSEPGVWNMTLGTGTWGGSPIAQVISYDTNMPPTGDILLNYTEQATITASNLTTTVDGFNITTFTSGLCLTNYTVSP